VFLGYLHMLIKFRLSISVSVSMLTIVSQIVTAAHRDL